MFKNVKKKELVKNNDNRRFNLQEFGNRTESVILSQIQNTENWTTSMENWFVLERKIFPGHTTTELVFVVQKLDDRIMFFFNVQRH